jgi:hypothetical protein
MEGQGGGEAQGAADPTKRWLEKSSLAVDVMITIFCDFCQFSAKKLALFSKTNVIIKILHT